MQLIAARIVTGLPVFASLNSIYAERGWKTLAERRKTKTLTLMCKIVNDPSSYLTDHLPSRVDVVSNYNLRNSQNFDGWMTCDLTSFLTVFQSYQDDVGMIMRGCVQWNSDYG